MKSIDKMLDRLYELYTVYERYIWKNEDVKLFIFLEECEISFLIYRQEKDECIPIDAVTLQFNDNEMNLCMYASLRYFIKIFGNVMIHKEDNVIYNDRHMPYLKMVIGNDELLQMISEIIDMQEEVFVNDDLEIVNELEKRLSNQRECSLVVQSLDEIIEIARLKIKEKRK